MHADTVERITTDAVVNKLTRTLFSRKYVTFGSGWTSRALDS